VDSCVARSTRNLASSSLCKRLELSIAIRVRCDHLIGRDTCFVKFKGFRAAILCFLVAAGCTSDGANPAAPRPSPKATVRRIGSFAISGDCGGLGENQRGQLSFVSGGELYVASRSGSVARCVLKVRHAADLEWGPEADRLDFGDLRRYDGSEIFSIDDSAESVAWSRPTGSSIVYISEGRLMKVNAFGDAPFEISFLADHDEIVYHPAGTHIAVTGTDEDGTYGLWLATNIGEEPQLLAIGEDARRIFSLAFSHDGKTIFYAAEHDDRYDVHALHLALQDDEGETRDAELETLDSAPTEVGDVVVSEFGRAVAAYTVGSCEQMKSTRVWDGSVTTLGGELGNLSTEPVGWLANGELLVLARKTGCEGKGTLYVWTADETTQLAAKVSAAGVRAVLPPPPDPPNSRQQVVA
jgi:hypothetical protein